MSEYPVLMIDTMLPDPDRQAVEQCMGEWLEMVTTLRTRVKRLEIDNNNYANDSGFQGLQIKRLKQEKAEAVKLLKQGTWSTTCDCGDCWQCRVRAYLSALDAPSKEAEIHDPLAPIIRNRCECCFEGCDCGCANACPVHGKPVCPDCGNPEDDCTCEAVTARVSKPACSYCGRPLPREVNAYCCTCGCEYPAAILPESKPVCPDCNGTGIEGGNDEK